MRKFLLSLFLVCLTAIFATPVQAQTPETPPADQYSQAKVIEILMNETATDDGLTPAYQKLKVQILSGPEAGKELEIEHGNLFTITEDQKAKLGQVVVITKTVGPTGELYYITDQYRIQPLLIIFGIFFISVLVLGKLRGVASIAGLILSIIILIQYVIPRILSGENPLTTSLTGALAIAVLSIYMAHGISKRTTLALASTIISLCFAALLSLLYVNLTLLSGTGSEEAIFLRMGPLGNIDLKGLLLGGIIIGTLGILDDITISQTAAIDEIRKANSRLGWQELFKRGIRVGREHVASLVNTLALAYVGASFPLLLLFSMSQDIPFWLTVNSEFIMEELVRTLVGSTALVMAVPISTFMAAYFLAKQTTVRSVAVKATTTKRKTSSKKTTRRKAS